MRTKNNANDITIVQELTINALFIKARAIRGYEWDYTQNPAHRVGRNTEIIDVMNQLERIWTDLNQDEVAVILGDYLHCTV